MSRLPPVPPAGRPTHGPDAMPKPVEDVTHRVRQNARRQDRPIEDSGARQPAAGPQQREAGHRDGGAGRPVGLRRPLLDVALAGFAGYVIGCLQARRRP